MRYDARPGQQEERGNQSTVGYLRQPSLSQNRLCFVAEGDIWCCELAGGIPRRITASGACKWPVLSPDAEHVAFSCTCLGTQEVFVVSTTAGGLPSQLTFFGKEDTVPAAWELDGSAVYAASSYGQPLAQNPALLRVPLQGGTAQRVPFASHDAEQLSFHASGRVLVGRATRDSHVARCKRYKGGRLGSIWVQEAPGCNLKQLCFTAAMSSNGAPGAAHTKDIVHVSDPMWVGDRIFFIADLDGCGNLWSVAADGNGLQQCTTHTGLYVRNPTANDEHTVVYERGGTLWRFTASTRISEPMNIDLQTFSTADMPKVHSAVAAKECAFLHPEGHHVLVGVRGRAFELALREGPALELRPPAQVSRHSTQLQRCVAMCYTATGCILIARETPPQTVDDGAFCLELHPPNPQKTDMVVEEERVWHGMVPGSVGDLRSISASPIDESLIAITNECLELQLLQLEADHDGDTLRVVEARVAARAEYGPRGIFDMTWSPGGRWLAFCSQAAPGCPAASSLWLLDVEAKPPVAAFRITDTWFCDFAPSFGCSSESEGFLAFLSRRVLQPVDDEVMYSMGFGIGCDRPYLLLLSSSTANPLERVPKAPVEEAPQLCSGLRGDHSRLEAAGFRDPFINIPQVAEQAIHVIEVPVETGHYQQLTTIDGGLLYSRRQASSSSEGNNLYMYNFVHKKEHLVKEGVIDFQLSLDGRTILVQLVESGLEVLSLDDAKGCTFDEDCNLDDASIDFGGRIHLEVNPALEWTQMFHETWHRLKMRYFDETMGGLDWSSVRDRYQPLLTRLGCREDLGDVIAEMVSELGNPCARFNQQCTSLSSASISTAMGFLGADLEWDDEVKAYTVNRVLAGDIWDPVMSSPFPRATPPLREGSHLLAVNRQRLTQQCRVEHLLQGMDGQEVFLTLVDRDNTEKAAPLLRERDATAPAPAGGVTCKKKPTKDVKRSRKSARKASTLYDYMHTVRVKCIGTQVEQNALYRDWVEKNLRTIKSVTCNRVGYVHIPDCGRVGFAEFHRYYLAQCQRESLIIDLRGTRGGVASEPMLDKLLRVPLGVNVPRRGRGQLSSYPSHCMRNPRSSVLVIDGCTCAEAECLAAAYRRMKLGVIVGSQSMGGACATGHEQRDLVDGSTLTIPTERLQPLSEDCSVASGSTRGIEPDIEVGIPPDWDPSNEDEELDPQLQKAVAVAERLIKERSIDAVAIMRGCQQMPRTRAHLRWRVSAPSGPTASPSDC